MPNNDGSSSDRGHYRQLIDSIPYGFYSLDTAGHLTETNPAFAAIFGYAPSELSGLPFQRLIPEDELERAERLFGETMAGELMTVELDIGIVRRDGARRLIHVAARTIENGGVVTGTHGIVRDVTEERAAEERLRSGERRLRLLLDRMPAILWTVDPELRFTSIIGGGLQALGLREDELVGMSLYDYHDTSDPDHPVIRAHRRALEGHPTTFQFERLDRVHEVRVEPMSENGGTVGAIGAALDVTERVETRRQLEEQRAHWQRLFEAAPEAIVVLDSQDRIVQSNPEFVRVFGYTSEESSGRQINDLIVPSDRRGEASGLSERVLGGERIGAEAIRCRKDGTRVDVSILGTPVDVGGEQWVYGVYRDITEQKKLQEKLLHSQRLDAVGQLAGGVAHDFNNILTAILGHARILASEVSEPWIREDIGEIEEAAERAAKLTRQLLTFSRRQGIERRPVDVSQVVESMRGMLRPVIGDHIQLETDLDPSLPAVSMDPGQLEQVVMNLIINSRDAMPSGGRVTVRTAVEESEVALEVADTGSGMTSEQRARMFEPFYTTKEVGKGTGLGLSTVYAIVEQSNGWIDVESAPGAGTTIRVHFPAVEGVADRARPPKARTTARPAPRGHEVVLLVDDDSAVRNVTRRILDRHGYTVTVAASGEEALEVARAMDPPPDLLLTDLVMPGMSGQALAAEIATLFPRTTILFMSGYTDSDLARGPVRRANLIAKPFDPSTLARRVREALG